MDKPTNLDVLLHGEPVGRLTLLEGDRSIFSFTPAYLSRNDQPTLGLGFKDIYGELITDYRPYQTRLMPFFSNLLPEGQLRRYLAARAGVKPIREFFLLWALGKDLPGAITIRAAEEESSWSPVALAKPSNDEGNNSGDTLLRFSLAGVQLKFSAVMETHGGLTIPAEGIGGSWIIKLPSTQYARVPENEFSMMTLARQIGIDVPDFRLIKVEQIKNIPQGIEKIEGKAFAIRRFDRSERVGAIHIEDFAQVFGVYPEAKYDRANARNIVNVIANECAMADVVEFIRRLVFNTLIGNADMHLKNWSLMYPNRRQAAIAPAYDFVSTVSYIPDKKAALKVSRSAYFADFNLDELTHLANKAKLPKRLVIETAQETVARFLQVWPAEKSNLPLSNAVVEAIDRHLTTVPLISQC